MSFASPIYLFYFFPIFAVIYLILPVKARPWFLLAGSLLFYIWGEIIYFPVLLVCILVNYIAGRKISQARLQDRPASTWMWGAVILDILILFFFKLYSAYAANYLGFLNIPAAEIPALAKNIYLPLGISFFTFAAISYIVDVYKGRTPSEDSLARFALYLGMFPKLAAGPITRFREVSAQLACPSPDLTAVANGLRRFSMGLAKKVLVANIIAGLADRIFAIPGAQLTAGLAWLGLLSYTLQIYYDFSGYTDMAVGVGQMLGFKFPENFNYPYISKSISDFWRRWHISLSNWFRDYVFFPLERKRHGAEGLQKYANVLIVFFLTGLWHGITPNFILWGLLHGAAISVETSKAGTLLKKAWAPLQHGYALLVIMSGWVFFRANTLGDALNYFKALAGFSRGAGLYAYTMFPPIDHQTWLALGVGILFAFPIFPAITRLREKLQASAAGGRAFDYTMDVLLIILLVVSIVVMVGSTFRPNIYAKF